MKLPAVVLGVLLASACTRQEPPAATDVSPIAGRVATLAPHLAELVVAAGARDTLVAVSSYTDFPEDLAGLPRIGDAFGLDREALTMAAPDTVLAWAEGTPHELIESLREQGFRVEVLAARTLSDISSSLERIGAITGRSLLAEKAAGDFRQSLGELGRRSSGRELLSVFYQVDTEPLYTIGGQHFISELIELCGGRNVFAELATVAAQVSPESVIERDPEVILAAGPPDASVFSHWRGLEGLRAVRANTFYLLTPGLIGRPGPRLAAGARELCESLEVARSQIKGLVSVAPALP